LEIIIPKSEKKTLKFPFGGQKNDFVGKIIPPETKLPLKLYRKTLKTDTKYKPCGHDISSVSWQS
jgi:hypothetical protein